MKITLRKKIKISDKITLPKTAKGQVVGIFWSENSSLEKYLADFPEGRFEIDKSDADINV